ncbi:MAG: hypothetical protein GOMPHAMPRED_000349 [Gomphillus americanus]|uniref:Uncharacterized protein n=1 Tax=Gomphillus americanus TaxID=1940652 RepID=A0A8H3HV11_9LECA|nr:MAG: hypothetical protein GOMPHAMPRED_000349 [Gomphillus americanus]
MQRVFWRALEARGSCNCAICTPIRPGLARKVNTLPAKRGIKFGDIVTIVYGTVLGTAAFYDGTSKKKRREKIDDALIGLLLQNEAAIRDQEARLKALGYNGSESASTLSEDLIRRASNADWTRWSTIFSRPALIKPAPSYARHYSTRYMNKEKKFASNNDGWWEAEMLARQEQRVVDRLQISSQPQDYMENTQFPSKCKGVPESSVPKSEARILGKSLEDAWEDMTLIPNRRNWQIREIAVTQLVLKLVKTYLTSIDTEKENVPTIQFTNASGSISRFEIEDVPDIIRSHKELSHRMECIKRGMQVPPISESAGPFQFPQFRVYGRSEGMHSSYHSDVWEQNDKLAAIFLQADSSANLISELCSFLVSQTCGPNIHTMNLLLLLFLDVQWYQACKAIISTISVLAANQNEVTDVAKLQYYHLTQQDLNLDAQRALMLCLDGRATRTAFDAGKLTVETFQPDQVTVRTRIQDGVQRTTHALKAGWTAEAFSIVIIDLLDRGELAEALAEIASMHLSGLQETPNTLEAMLQYSVFKEDWDVALKSWTRFEELSYTKSVLTWYWMLQACATCRQTHNFYNMVSMGIQQGVLSRDVEYSIEAFNFSISARDKLKRKTHALQRLKYRISIPRLPQRDLHVQGDDIIQMPNLEQTMLMAYLQYAKLRKSTSGWFVDHLEYLRSAEEEFQSLVQSLHASPKVLRSLRERWAIFDAKLEMFATVRNGGYIAENVTLDAAIKRMVLDDYACVGSGDDISAATTHTEMSPAGSKLYETSIRTESILSRIHEGGALPRLYPETSNSGLALSEHSSLSRLRVNIQQLISGHHNSLKDGTANQTHGQQTSTEGHTRAGHKWIPENRWLWTQHLQSSDDVRPPCIPHIKDDIPDVVIRKVPSGLHFTKVVSQPRKSDTSWRHVTIEPLGSIPESGKKVELEFSAVQLVEEELVQQQNQRSAQVTHQDDDNVDMNEEYAQDHRLAAVA